MRPLRGFYDLFISEGLSYFKMADEDKLQKYRDHLIKEMDEHLIAGFTIELREGNKACYMTHREDLAKLVELFPEIELSEKAKEHLERETFYD